MHRSEQQKIYLNLKYLCKTNHLTYRDLGFYLDIPYETLMSLAKRKTRIEERYGHKFSDVLNISTSFLFHKLLEESNPAIHMYFNIDHYRRIIDEYFDKDEPWRIDHRASGLHTICRIIANSPVKLYIDFRGWAMVVKESVEENRPRDEGGVSSSFIRLDSSVSVKDYEARKRSLRIKDDAYDEEVELIIYLKDRINLFFPCNRDAIRYKKIFLYNMVYRISHEKLKERCDYDRGYQRFLKDKKIAEEIAYDAFGFWDKERTERFYAHLIVRKGDRTIEDLNEKIRLYRRYRKKR